MVNRCSPGPQSLAAERGLHPTAVQDCLDPEHLPKFEKSSGVTFVIVRAADEQADASAVTVQQLTRKVAIFLGPGFLISIHRKDQPFLVALHHAWSERKPTGAPEGEDPRRPDRRCYSQLRTAAR